MRTEVLIEKNLIFSFDSISTLCSFQCARSVLTELLQYHSFSSSCQQLFQVILNFLFRFTGCRFRQLLYITKRHLICQHYFFIFFRVFRTFFNVSHYPYSHLSAIAYYNIQFSEKFKLSVATDVKIRYSEDESVKEPNRRYLKTYIY